MANNLYNTMYNPAVLSCIANLSNDEVFTPPDVANAMLDMLPQELFSNPEITFLDPACKSGVFLREIAKRLLKGLESLYPDLQERTDHIFKYQLYGVAITELTAHLSRRSVYCSKTANGNYSVAHMDTVDGNIRYKIIQHRFQGGKCVFCGASESEYGHDRRGDDLETHAYEMIHTTHPEEIFKMKFDVIIGNPPYQLSDGGNGVSASPIYQRFIEQAIKLNPRYLSMIVPSRYFAGGKGLDAFRERMLSDRHLVKMVDFINAKDCFPQNSISGGVHYFLWDRDHEGDCEFTTVLGDKRDTKMRKLNEFSTFVRYNSAVEIIHKVHKGNFQPLSDSVSSRNPFGIPTSARGEENPRRGYLKLVSSKGIGYVPAGDVIKGQEFVSKYKIMVSRITYEHAGEPDKDGKLKVLSRVEILAPNEVCTDSYLIIGGYDTYEEAENLMNYLKTKFARFLVSQTLSAINLSKDKFGFIPVLDFKKPVSEEELYERYNLTAENIEFINSLIHDFDMNGGDE